MLIIIIQLCIMEALLHSYLILSAIFLLFHLLKIINHRRRQLPPSPAVVSLPLLGHLHLLKKPLHRTLANLSAQHGPILLLQFGLRPVLLVSSSSAAQECFTKNDIAFANRPRLDAGKYLGCNYTNLLWAPYGPLWRDQRRIAALQILSPARIQMYGAVRAEEVESLIHRLQAEMGDGFRAVEMKRVFFETVLNVMMRMIGGKRYCGEIEEEAKEAERLREIVKEGFEVSGAVNVGDFLPFMKWVRFGNNNGIEKRMERLQGLRDGFMQSLIEERRRFRRDSSAGDDGVMADVLLDLQETDPHYYTDQFIRNMMQGMLSASTDTSSATMEWALALLLNNPHSLLKAQAEIDAHVPPNRLLQESDLTTLPYLHAIIKETLRLYPPAPLLAPHESSQDCLVGGFHVARGTMLLVNNWAIQNHAQSWEDPGEFRPERFQGEFKEAGLRWFPFGAGRRGCPGEGLAMRMVGLCLGCLIQCFEWRRLGEEMVDMTEGGGLTMPRLKPLWAMFRPRPISASFCH